MTNQYMDMVLQSIEMLCQCYPKQTAPIFVNRTQDHWCRSNSWLKYHKKPMRRKPFRQYHVLLDEFGNICENTRREKNEY